MNKFLILALCCFSLVTARAEEPQGAHLRLDNPTYDFGDAPRKGGDLIHEFAFRNDGTSPLVLLRVLTSCSCLKANYPKQPIAPGASGVIRITYEPHKSEPGAFNKVIQIYSNSTPNRDVLTVQGNSIDGTPRKVKVKSSGEVKIKERRIKNKTNDDITQ